MCAAVCRVRVVYVPGVRMTVQTQAVLLALLHDLDTPLYGLEIADRTGLLPGTTYPILVRLERAGWVTSYWEEIDPREEQRPRRKYYKLTGQGIPPARVAAEQLRASQKRALQQWGLADGTSS
jgi:PadR family transcriptional regulator PadR